MRFLEWLRSWLIIGEEEPVLDLAKEFPEERIIGDSN